MTNPIVVYEVHLDDPLSSTDESVIMDSLPRAKIYVEDNSSSIFHHWNNSVNEFVCNTDDGIIAHIYKRKIGVPY